LERVKVSVGIKGNGRKITTYERIILDAVGLAPGGHDEGVVEGDADDEIDALGLEVAELRQVARDMRHLAGGRESSRDGD
jgi:hypothetical protein